MWVIEFIKVIYFLPDFLKTKINLNEILTPRPLVHGDRIAILSPSGIVKPQLVYDCLPVLADQGWVPYVCENAFKRCEGYAGTDAERYADLETAWLAPDTRAIFCSRGGYGAVHLLERLDRLPLRDDPKWIIGYSDISALHALMTRHGIKSHRLFSLLSGSTPEVRTGGYSLNRQGSAEGLLVGGNLAVIAGLISTPFDVIRPGSILFIEDIAEPIYKTERILYTMKLNGTLASLAGLIVGQFTDYAPDRGASTMEEMISHMVEDYDYPVAYNFPVGHVRHNIPMLCSSKVRLGVTSGTTKLTTLS